MTPAAKQAPKTKEEQHLRLRSLFEEEGRESFRKGGAKSEKSVVADVKPVIGEADDVDPEEEIEDNENDVSQEDRIAAQ